ncbi:hypothetical protein GPALN_012658 [Globodera pallida]|nr:hypothetical protein GPALN_012658 [Globodera pallida]
MSQQHSTGSAPPSADKSLPPLQSQHGTEHPVAGGLLSPGPASSNSEPAVISGNAGGLDISRQDGTGHPVAGEPPSPGGCISSEMASSNSEPAVISGNAGGHDISRQDGTGHPVAGGLLPPGCPPIEFAVRPNSEYTLEEVLNFKKR